jgi:hypothetical protein
MLAEEKPAALRELHQSDDTSAAYHAM